jgi:hypothetical protein
MSPTQSQAQRLPWHLEAAVRFGTSPTEWPDALACYERVYGLITVADGEAKAKRWAIKNTAWLIAAGVIQIFR